MLNRGVLLVGIALLSAAPADGGPRVRLGGVSIGAGYTHLGGYYRYPYYWGCCGYWPRPYGPWIGPFFHPGYFAGFARSANMGEVKIRTGQKDASVFIDGGYAGTADKLKSIWLEPGTYELELRTGDRSYARKIYVLSGKSLRIQPEFQP